MADDVEYLLKQRAITTVVIAEDGEWPQDLISVNADQPAPEGMGNGAAPSLLLSTSGTTGDTKLVVWTQCQMSALEQSARARGFGSSDRVLLVMPMMHGGGIAAFASCLLTGAQVVLIQFFSSDAVLNAIGRYGCTSLMGLPSMWAQLAEAQLKRDMDVGSLRLCLSVADVCPADTERAVLQSFGLPLLSFWASTEEPCAGTPGSRPGPFFDLIVDAQSKTIDVSDDGKPTADAGEFLVRSPGTSPGYWHDQTVHKISEDGFFSSGDLVRVDNGHFTYLGRLKDLIVRGGSNISPIEVEHALIVHPGIDDVAVIGLPHPTLGQRVAAAIVLASDANERAVADAVEKAKMHLADYKLPERTIVVQTIPRNNLSKVDRRAIEALFD